MEVQERKPIWEIRYFGQSEVEIRVRNGPWRPLTHDDVDQIGFNSPQRRLAVGNPDDELPDSVDSKRDV